MASSSGSGMNFQTPMVSIFDGENYDFWCVKMRTSFECVDLWDIVENGFEEPEQVSDLLAAQLKELKENRIRNANALSMLHRAVSNSIFFKIMRAKMTKNIIVK